MRILVRSAMGFLCAVAGYLALGAPLAPAAVTHEYLPGLSAKLNEAEPTPLTGPFNTILSMTVDSGELYVVDNENSYLGQKKRVDKFGASTGAFNFQFPQFPSPENTLESIVVGHSTGEAQVYLSGDEEIAGKRQGVVTVLSTTGAIKKTWTGADTPNKAFAPFGGQQTSSIAVDANPSSLNDWAAGDVYVDDEANKVVDVFKPLAGGGEEYVTQLAGPEPPGTLFEDPIEVAVNPLNGEVFVVNLVGVERRSAEVDIFKPAQIADQYEFVGKLSGPPPGGKFGRVSGITIDGGAGLGDGDIYIADRQTEGNEAKVIDQFNAEGAYIGQITGTPQGPAPETSGPFSSIAGIAVDPETHDVYVADYRGELGGPTQVDVFGPDIVFPDVTTGALTAEKATGSGAIEAILNGTVNPDKEGEASCRFDWGTTKELGQLAPCEPEKVAEGDSPVAVHARLPSLAPDTTYYYRLQASNKNGTNPGEAWQDKEFTTSGPGFHAASVLAIRAESGTFNAKINPHGHATSAYFQYGTSAVYGTDAPLLNGTAEPGLEVGSGEGGVEVSQHVSGLSPATVYHYRVVVVSELAPGQFEYFYGPDQTFTTQVLGAPLQLPDGRAWEMVSPPQKEGALLSEIGNGGLDQAAANGSAFVETTSAPTEAEPPGNGNYPMVFFGRGSSGWSSKVIVPPHLDRTGVVGTEYAFFSEDLSEGLAEPEGPFLPLSPEATEPTPYLHSDYAEGNTGELCASNCYTPLITDANVPSGTKFGAGGSARFLGASQDLHHVLLESKVALTPTSIEGFTGLYEWSDGSLSLINVLPKGETNAHGGDIAEQAAVGDNLTNQVSSRRVVSNEGARIVWHTEKGLYLWNMGENIKLNVAQGVERPYENEAPVYATASSDGTRVFFFDTEQLTADATAKSGRPDLYEYNLNAQPGSRLSDLSADTNAPANVKSVLGTGEDGSYVYFTAAGVLAPGATPGECGDFDQPPPGDTQLCNLYLSHNGTTTFVAGLAPADFPAWDGQSVDLPARVSPNGQWLAFMSSRDLTGYETTDAISNEPDEEVYLYNGQANKLICASCNPTGARPVGVKYSENQITGLNNSFAAGTGIAANVPVWTDNFYQSRYLGNDGRLFFNSSDALVPQDVNGTEDVYEYEPAGIGSCATSQATFSERSEGCVGLISSGEAKEESVFLDASESGGDVFFLTAAKLSTMDFDESRDVYDARECTTLPCFATPPVEPPPCETGDSCKPAPSPQPAIFGAPASATFSGAGNIVPPPSAPAAKQKSLTRAQKLARALKSCRKDKKKKRRSVCERQARSHYSAKKSRKANATKRGRG